MRTRHILASEGLWRFSVAAELFYLLCAVVLVAIFYVLLRPVSRDLALLAVLFNLVSVAVEAVGRLQLISALGILRSADRAYRLETDFWNANDDCAESCHSTR